MKFSVVTLFAGAVAGASLGDYKVFEKLSSIPTPWIAKDDAEVDAKQSFKLRIHLKNQNIEAFEQKVMDISTPDHPEYGRHLDLREVNDLLAPSKQSFNLVQEWIQAQGLSDKATIQNDWVVVDATVGDVEKLLQADYELFENTETGKVTVRTLAYSLPASLHAHIDIIAPTIKFTTPSPEISTIAKDFPAPAANKLQATDATINGINVACNTSITPACLRDLYSIGKFQASSTNGNEIGLAGFLEEYAQHDDLTQFLNTYDPKANASDFKEVLINGGVNTQDSVSPGQNIVEANLDIQYGLSIAYPTPSTYFSTAGRPPETTNYEVDNEPYLEFLTFLLAQKKIPQTISISYGDAEWTVPPTYAKTVCNLFAQVAARGVSVLVSSGDAGSGSNCSATSPGTLLYTPNFPASCPFVTTVGGTRYVEPERAVSFSGGGFSNYFPRPSYQSTLVEKYLKREADPAFTKYYNTTGRAYPDVSAQGVYFHTILDGEDGLVSGTSASSPAFAGIVALLNSDRIDNGLPPFGFLNPWLYDKAGSGLLDIKLGKSSGCSQIPGSGFAAVKGWDPVTGLGTPNFKKLRHVSTGR